ncbi:MAG: DUF3168 domain-containing protein [Devosia sp.]
MTDASLELCTAMLAALQAASAVTDLVGSRIYDRAPDRQSAATENVPFPYISLGPTTAVPDDIDCMDGEEITVQLDIWSSGAGAAWGSAECRKIAGALKRALHGVELTLADNAVVSVAWELTRILDDPDPTIKHGVVQFTAIVETP